MTLLTLSWIDDTGAHTQTINSSYLAIDPMGYLDALRTGDMWNICLIDEGGRDVTYKHL